ncbi:unnamed protein product, partial [Rotaria sp. Silwood1]
EYLLPCCSSLNNILPIDLYSLIQNIYYLVVHH